MANIENKIINQMKQSDKKIFKEELNITPYDKLESPFNKIADKLQQNDIKMYGKVRDDTFNRLVKKIREADFLYKQDKKITDPTTLKMINTFLNIEEKMLIKGTREYDERSLYMNIGSYNYRKGRYLEDTPKKNKY
tara:strand:+ start:49 stop:456 length:408 start_codon:yes stop_codon:yes gene_type:complete